MKLLMRLSILFFFQMLILPLTYIFQIVQYFLKEIIKFDSVGAPVENTDPKVHISLSMNKTTVSSSNLHNYTSQNKTNRTKYSRYYITCSDLISFTSFFIIFGVNVRIRTHLYFIIYNFIYTGIVL